MSLRNLIQKLSGLYPDAEIADFSFSLIDSALCIAVQGTDVHPALREGKSNKDQIDLTYGETLPLGVSPVDDFFPSVLRPRHLQQSRHLKLVCSIWGGCLPSPSVAWIKDEVDVVRIDRNQGRNPGLQLRGVDPLRKVVGENEWIIFIHRRGESSYKALTLAAGEWENPSGRKAEVFLESERPTRVDFDYASLGSVRDQAMVGCNIIFFGPPGTGKSTEVNRRVANHPMYRTQFHPEFGFAEFVGSYRPVVGFENDPTDKILGFDGVPTPRPINYFSFVPGPFTLALEHALTYEYSVFLVIEEINRGDCASVFGDLFQLLDRASSGQSEFGINIRPEMLAYLKAKGVKYDVSGDNKLYLPPNLSILATMNTSDQSLFPMDAAFKRRWQWIACPIDFKQLLAYTGGIRPILFDGIKRWDWIELVAGINRGIVNDRMEDKQIGPWFIKPDDTGQVSWDAFVNKALFYLWHDVFRDDQLTSESSPFKADGPTVFSLMQENIKNNGLEAGFKQQLLVRAGAEGVVGSD